MFKNTAIALLVLVALFGTLPTQAVTWPAYENTVRTWGIATAILASTNFVGFTLVTPAGDYVRFECPNPNTFGCNLIHAGDSILISGHQDSDIIPGCVDGVVNHSVPNVIWNCNTGVCVQITP